MQYKVLKPFFREGRHWHPGQLATLTKYEASDLARNGLIVVESVTPKAPDPGKPPAGGVALQPSVSPPVQVLPEPIATPSETGEPPRRPLLTLKRPRGRAARS